MYHFKTFTLEKANNAIDLYMDLYADFRVERRVINDRKQLAIVEDAFVVYFEISDYWDSILDKDSHDITDYKDVVELRIEEVTPNSILDKYNHAKFKRDFEEKYSAASIYIHYRRFEGISKHNKELSQYTDSIFPDLIVADRLNSWEGFLYNIVVYEMEAADGKKSYAIDAIKSQVHTHVLQIADRLIKQNYDQSVMFGFGLASIYYYVDNDFVYSYKSHKNTRKVERLQEHFKYFTLNPQYFRDLSKIRPYLKKVLKRIHGGKYDSCERVSYLKPEYKWKSEELVYKIIKKHYKDQGVIYQHRPYYLKSSIGGQMSFDVYISSLKVAVEYQGKQHFEPVDYFGGQESYEKLIIRDKEKAEICKEQGIKLVYINYWEDISLELIKEKIGEL